MKSGALLSVVGALGCAGYFGYTWFNERKAEKARQAEAEAAKQARLHPKPAPAEPGPLPGPDPSGPSAGGHEVERTPTSDGLTLKVPDLTGLSEDDARALVKKAGFDVSRFGLLENTRCSVEDDHDMLPVGQVCGQQPSADSEVGPLTPIKVVLETDTYEAGQIGSPMEWHRMPDLLGQTEAQAKRTLADKGFAADAFVFSYQAGCGTKGQVCKQHPDPDARAVKARKGEVVVSR